jgi:hypothetical protein
MVLLALQKMPHHGQMDDFIGGGGRGLGAGRHGITHRRERLTMPITGKQNPSKAATAEACAAKTSVMSATAAAAQANQPAMV